MQGRSMSKIRKTSDGESDNLARDQTVYTLINAGNTQ